MPNTQCPIPHSQSEIIRLQHPSGTSQGKIPSYVLIWGASHSLITRGNFSVGV
ncbi:hypothetical protein [Nostoc sp.]|uniref:hypothetical protein n=1 Tax=Nostoc sp. TaxID=1180 RepID=UPI002FF3587D